MTGAAISAASVSQRPLAVTIDAGLFRGGTTTPYNFPTNNAHPTGGTGSYAYAWAIVAGDGFGFWSFTGQGTAGATVRATSVAEGETSVTTLSLTVTDTKTGRQAAAQPVVYSFHATGGHNQ